MPAGLLEGVADGRLSWLLHLPTRALITWVVVFANFGWFAKHVGRDATLSGRRQIWADVRAFFWVHPVRGYGFWAIWEQILWCTGMTKLVLAK